MKDSSDSFESLRICKLGLELLHKEEYRESIKAFSYAIANNINQQESRIYRATSFYNIGDNDQAWDDINIVDLDDIKMKSVRMDAANLRGRLKYNRGDLKGAVDDYLAYIDEGKQISSRRYIQIFSEYAQQLLDEGKNSEAKSLYSRYLRDSGVILKSDNEDIIEINNYAWAVQLFNEKKYKKATKYFTYAIEDNVFLGQSYGNRAESYGYLGEYDKALDDVNMIDRLRLTPENLKYTRYLKAILKYNRGDIEGAIDSCMDYTSEYSNTKSKNYTKIFLEYSQKLLDLGQEDKARDMYIYAHRLVPEEEKNNFLILPFPEFKELRNIQKVAYVERLKRPREEASDYREQEEKRRENNSSIER